MTIFHPISQDRCDGCGRNRSGYYLRRHPHMAAAFRSGVPLPTIAAAYGMSQQWALKLIQEQFGLDAVREVQEAHRVGYEPDCDMCGNPVADDQYEFVNDQKVHSDCLFGDDDVFTEAEIRDRLLDR